MGIGNSVENNTKNINDVVTKSIMDSLQSATNKLLQSQSIKAFCQEDVAKAALAAKNECTTTLAKEFKDAGYTADELAKLIKDSCPYICQISDISQNQALDRKTSIQEVQNNKQNIVNSVTAGVTSYVDNKAPGGIGNSVKVNTTNIGKSVSTMLQKNAQEILTNATVTQSIEAVNTSVNLVTQTQVSQQMLQALQNQTSYQNAVNNLATDITSTTKLSSVHIVIIVILVIVVLCVVAYMVHVYMKNKKSKSGGGTESRKSESRSISTRRR